MILITNTSTQSDSTNVRVLQFRAHTFTRIFPGWRLPATVTRAMSFSDEKAAFEGMLPMLFSQFPGEHVAVANGDVAEHDVSRRNVVRRYFASARRGPVYIGFVGPKRVLRQASALRTRLDARIS